MILVMAAAILILSSLFITDIETQNIVLGMGFAMILGFMVCDCVSPEIGYKPTREELENNI